MNHSTSSSVGELPIRRIRIWQHGRAVSQMLRAYPPGTDALVDRIRGAGFLTRFAFRILLPAYFAREQGWVVRGPRGAILAMMYLRRNHRRGVRVMHIDDISVDSRNRHQGLARRLMNLAEILARREKRPFLKLAVTVANTPAVSLYRSLGYREQHHKYFTFDPTSVLPSATTTDLRLRPLPKGRAWRDLRRFYQIEMLASDPDAAELMVTYYPRGAGERVPKTGALRFAIELSGQQVGYADAFHRDAQWNLRLHVRPESWGLDSERQAILQLATAVRKDAQQVETPTLALHVPSARHFEALCVGEHALAQELRFTAHSYDRMIMVKTVSTSEQP